MARILVPLRIFEADKGLAMTASQAKRFLSQSRSNLLLGTIDEDGDPNIHAVWYYFDASRTKLYFITAKSSKKARALRRRATVYFSMDEDDSYDLRGVRGKGRAMIITDKKRAMALGMKVLLRYLKPDHSLTLEYADEVRRGNSVVVEITPAYFTTWDSENQPPETLAKQKAGRSLDRLLCRFIYRAAQLSNVGSFPLVLSRREGEVDNAGDRVAHLSGERMRCYV